MTPTAHWSKEATQDADEIYDYIGQEKHSPQAADNFALDIRNQANLYATHPGIGKDRPDLGEGHMRFIFKRWAVIYRDIDDGIEILRVFDTSRDYGKLFSS